jgi:hypothetical protein
MAMRASSCAMAGCAASSPPRAVSVDADKLKSVLAASAQPRRARSVQKFCWPDISDRSEARLAAFGRG